MVKPRPGVVERTGKKYLFEPKPGMIYVRRGGKYYGQIKAPEGTPEFDLEYWELLRGKKFEPRTSFSALIKSYRGSDRWTGLKPNTRRTYEAVLIYIEEKNGARDATRTRRKDVIAAQSANFEQRPKFANDLPRIMSVLFEHAIDLGWMDHNPAKGVKKRKIPTERQRPHVPWTDEACAMMRAEGSDQARLIFELGVGSVQRPGDLVNFTWGDFDGESLELDQNKTGKALKLPCSEELKRELLTEKRRIGGSPHPSRPILTGQKGRKMSVGHMSQVLRRERARLGLMKFDQHAMRYRGVMELAWANCDDDEIMAYSGHNTKEMVIKYAGLARQIMRAKTAAEKRRLWASA